jgi:hypothetical protein
MVLTLAWTPYGVVCLYFYHFLAKKFATNSGPKTAKIFKKHNLVKRSDCVWELVLDIKTS